MQTETAVLGFTQTKASLSAQTASTSWKAIWAGRTLSGLITVFLIFDSGVKLMKLPVAVEGTVRLGYPAGVIVPLGVVLLASVVLYIVGRTSILGAILLTGYLGGATATQVRVEDPWFVFPVALGVLVWL